MMQPEKLKIKLKHWAEHNSSHTTSFRKQAQEAGEMGQHDIEAELLLAAETMDMAGSHLQKAIKILGDTQD